MSDAYVTIDATGNPILMAVREARKARPKRKPPTRAELGLAPAQKSKPSKSAEPELSAAEQAAMDKFYADYEARRAAFFSSTVDGHDPLAPEVRHGGEILFSDSGGSGKSSKGAMTIAEAAKQAGLAEDDMTTRLVGKARMKMVKGELVVSVADVNRLAKAGKLPNPGKVRQAKETITEDEKAASADVAVAKAAGAAAAIGVAIGPNKPDAPKLSGVTTAKAGDRGRRRLGAPQRWTAAR